jgi:hypothetical protein
MMFHFWSGSESGSGEVNMKAAYIFCFSLMWLCLTGHAMWGAEIKCLDDKYNRHEGICVRAGLIGEIVRGDSERLAVFLESFRDPPSISLNSPGGDFLEGLRIGRVLSSHLVSVSAVKKDENWPLGRIRTCGTEQTEPCCASACALAYFGGAQWDSVDFLGLHRPSATEFTKKSFSEAVDLSEIVRRIVSAYFTEMGVGKKAFDAMMETAPDDMENFPVGKLLKRSNNADQSLFVDFIYPTSVYDWLLPACADQPLSKMDCINDALSNSRSWPWNADKKYSYKQHLQPEEINDEIEFIRSELSGKTYNIFTTDPFIVYELDRLDYLRLAQDEKKFQH